MEESHAVETLMTLKRHEILKGETYHTGTDFLTKRRLCWRTIVWAHWNHLHVVSILFSFYLQTHQIIYASTPQAHTAANTITLPWSKSSDFQLFQVLVVIFIFLNQMPVLLLSLCKFSVLVFISLYDTWDSVPVHPPSLLPPNMVISLFLAE